MNRLSIRRLMPLFAAAVLAATAACGPMRDSVAQSTPDSVAAKPETTSSVASTPPAKTPIVATKSPLSTAVAVPAKRDTSKPKNEAPFDIPAGRTSHDSTSFIAAIRDGRRAVENWPAHTVAPGSILPAKRIVAFYGNPLVKKMGVLGEYPVDQMLAKFDTIIGQWNAADPSTPVQPALHLIAVVAQGTPGRDGKYRLRMADTLVERVYGWAQSRHAILFLDIQVGASTVAEELPRFMKFLERPDVHLGIDPEFSMHYSQEGKVPSSAIGVMDASDINVAVDALSKLVAEKGLPPKILIVHRFTGPMVRNAANIKLDPNVQVVMNMDGFGPPWLKFDSYDAYVVKQPVQFTGFKVFFHGDKRLGDPILTPAEILRLLPRPMYIQYQ